MKGEREKLELRTNLPLGSGGLSNSSAVRLIGMRWWRRREEAKGVRGESQGIETTTRVREKTVKWRLAKKKGAAAVKCKLHARVDSDS